MYTVAGKERGRSSGVGSEVVLDGDVFEVVEEFVYLGTLVTCDKYVCREVKSRIAAANRAFNGLRNQLRSRNLQTSTKFALYKILVLPVALYGHEAWTLREADRRGFGVFERKVLRTILRGICENGVWCNHGLYQVYKTAGIVKQIKYDINGLFMCYECRKKNYENNIQQGARKRMPTS
ncbi:uncharacterized protein LOC131695584 [Topomyia yanbarensis]|uniref:uncharacterized protein LOC131695584 n=1 Tax=Topomyia yanbarensis TaxID=2498891 RepID=UPI00273AA100|nr:uncharacterized protein LOC131695584 [Topomyia yanbarensis]